MIPIVANTFDAAWTLCLVSITVGPLSCHLQKLRVSADMFVGLICCLSVDNYGLLGTSSQFGLIVFFGRYFFFGCTLRPHSRAQGLPSPKSKT